MIMSLYCEGIELSVYFGIGNLFSSKAKNNSFKENTKIKPMRTFKKAISNVGPGL
jgi:hypothetical protein